MTVDALEYLRTEDPVPDGSSAPPMEWMLARIAGEGVRPARRRRIRFALVPTLAVAATIAVVAAVVVVAVTHRAHTPAHVAPATRTAPALRTVPPPESLMPGGGMPGMLLVMGVASPAPNTNEIWFGQCQPCHAGGAGRGSATRDWMAITTDGGASWRAAHASANLNSFAFSGADGWAQGLQSDGHGDGGVARDFASHDGGRTWHGASSTDAAAAPMGDVSIAGGQVWTLGSHCSGRCTGSSLPVDVVLRGPASGSHLARTAGQPPLGDTTNVSVVGTAQNEAFVLTDDYSTNPKVAQIAGTRLFATHDGGRTWQRMPAACPRHAFGRLYGVAGALWATCDPMRAPTEVRRSIDGGRHWTTSPAELAEAQVQPASAQVAWAVVKGGRVVRTADGGETWSQVWYGGRPEPTELSGNSPVLTVQSPMLATVVTQVTRGHVDGHAARTNFVTYRTTDGGRTWRPSVVRLPAG